MQRKRIVSRTIQYGGHSVRCGMKKRYKSSSRLQKGESRNTRSASGWFLLRACGGGKAAACGDGTLPSARENCTSGTMQWSWTTGRFWKRAEDVRRSAGCISIERALKTDSNLAEGERVEESAVCRGRRGTSVIRLWKSNPKMSQRTFLREQLGSQRGLPFGSVAERMFSSQ